MEVSVLLNDLKEVSSSLKQSELSFSFIFPSYFGGTVTIQLWQWFPDLFCTCIPKSSINGKSKSHVNQGENSSFHLPITAKIPVDTFYPIGDAHNRAKKTKVQENSHFYLYIKRNIESETVNPFESIFMRLKS